MLELYQLANTSNPNYRKFYYVHSCFIAAIQLRRCRTESSRNGGPACWRLAINKGGSEALVSI